MKTGSYLAFAVCALFNSCVFTDARTDYLMITKPGPVKAAVI